MYGEESDTRKSQRKALRSRNGRGSGNDKEPSTTRKRQIQRRVAQEGGGGGGGGYDVNRSGSNVTIILCTIGYMYSLGIILLSAKSGCFSVER